MVELATPKRMVLNAVFIAAIGAVVLFLSDFTVGELIDIAADNPLFTAGVGLVVVIGILIKSDAEAGVDAGD